MAPPTKAVPDADKATTTARKSTSAQRAAQLTGHLVFAQETEQVNTRPQLPIDYPVSRLQLDPSHLVDDVRPLRVAVVGAGLGGITAGILLPAKVPGINLTIYDKNHDVSGTWLENVYPGVRCDIPAHVYQSTISPNTQWSEVFAAGGEIRNYWQSVAKKHDVYKYLKLRHRVDEATWNDTKSKWALSVYDLNTDSSSSQEFDFVILAIGRCM
jgi:heterodisulfide reductase subunit A-like polyferredoxin